MATMNIMEMKSGTVIKNKRSGSEYVLGDYVNNVARQLTMNGMCGALAVDYINKNTQDDYEVILPFGTTEEYKYLSQCKDFDLLCEHYSGERLRDFEHAIEEYENSSCSEDDFEKQAYYGYSDIINWYCGTMSTEQLFDFLEE